MFSHSVPRRRAARARLPAPVRRSKVRALYEQLGVSSVMVIGGSGQYFDVADTVVMMESYSGAHARTHSLPHFCAVSNALEKAPLRHTALTARALPVHVSQRTT